MLRRRLLLATALTLPLHLAAQGPAPKETTWEELMPKDWDPMKELGMDKLGNIGLVQEGSVKERNLMRQMREVWDNAPTNPKMDGARVRLPGYVVPLEEVKGDLKEFLLVPYFGACIHSPPPPANQIIHVIAKPPVKALKVMDPVTISGPLQLERSDVDVAMGMGKSGYKMRAELVKPYQPAVPAN